MGVHCGRIFLLARDSCPSKEGMKPSPKDGAKKRHLFNSTYVVTTRDLAG
jgi:hypothetical protein